MDAILNLEEQPLVEEAHDDQEVFLLPVSFAQQRLWFLSRLHPGSPAYNMSSAYRLTGDLRIPALRHAVDEVVRRHEVLRTTFAVSDGEPVQVVAGGWRTALPVVDLDGLTPDRREAEIQRILAAEAERPFDLLRGPLLRLLALRCGAREHVLFCGLHHIVTDGWSEAIFARELGVLYTSFAAGRPSPLPELPIQYGDFAQWQRDWLQGETLDNLLDYWKRQLAGAPTILDLPSDRPRPAVFSHKGAVEMFEVPPDVAARLRSLQEREGVTTFVLLLTAFGVLLHRYSGQEDLLVGTPVANRSRAELEDLIGLFVNTLVLRLEMSGNRGFRRLLQQVRETLFGAQEHQDLLFERLVSGLDLDRGPSRNPLFQVVFTLDNTPSGDVEVQGLAMTPVPLPARTAKFDLQLTMREAGPRLVGGFEYATDLFEAASIRRMAGHFLTLLAAIAEAPDRRVRELPLLGPAEREEILRWSRPAGGSGDLFCLHEAFAVQAARAPGSVAVVCEGQELTYGELHRRSDQLASRLQALGAGPETRVGIYMERSADIVVAILGVLKAGGAYVPLDTAYPAERLAFMLEDSASEFVVTQSGLVAHLAGAAARILPIDELEPGGAFLPPQVTPWNAAYVIYTSGSTGRPKGVVVPHANVARLFNATRDWFHFDAGDVWTLFHSHAFDFSVWELWGALLHGGRLVVVPYLTSRSPELFAELLHHEGVTVLNQTPSAFRALTLAIEDGETPRPRGLRWVVFGGEALELQSLEPWWRVFGDRRPVLVNMYGITETTVHVTYRPLSLADLDAGAGSMVGRSIPDLDLYVLDPSTRDLVPVGVPGELHVGGGGLARGYLGRPSLTAERFVPDPFSGRSGARLYRSGDLARWRPDGDLEYLGRIDDQVKIRGFRIELGEIEAALRRQPGVRDAFAMLREDAPGDRQLVAYFVAEGEALSQDFLRASLSRELPDYMVPAAFVALEALPLTPHGKIDRRALPAPNSLASTEQRYYVAPRNELEEVLASVWAETLRVDRVGVHDSFFALGGDSIRSLRVVAAARERGLHFPVHQLFQFPTVAKLAANLSAAGAKEVHSAPGTEPFSLLSPADREKLPPGLEDAYPLSGLQTGMLFHMQENPSSPVFHNVNSYFLRLPFEPEAFQRAVQHIVERHATLRTSFDLFSYSEPLQLVHREADCEVTIDDVRHLLVDEQQRRVSEYWQQEVGRPFDLSQAPQLRFHVHWRDNDRFQFTLTENHAILDGWSLHTIYSEMLTCYLGLLQTGELPALPPLTTKFREFIHLERQSLESAETREFWRRKLSGGTVPRFYRQSAGPLVESGPRCLRIDTAMPPDLTEGLRRFARAEELSLKSILLTAHLKVIGLLAGQTDVITGLSSNGRPETPDGQRIAGLFLNTLPMRVDVSGGSWRELARRTYEAEIEIMPHRRFPLPAIQSLWGQGRLLETSFVYLNFHVMGDVVKAHGIELVDLASGVFIEETNFALITAFQHSYTSPGMIFNLTCDLNVLSEEQIHNLSGYYMRVLQAMALDPAAPSEDFSPLSVEERTQVLVSWSSTGAPVRGRLVHEAFKDWAWKTPDRVAVMDGDDRLTYRELDRRSNQLARYLAGLGVGPEARVALCLERSLEMVVAVLAVLKAGGAYVPLDPTLPADRLTYLLADSNAGVIVTGERWRDHFGSPPVVLLDADRDRIGRHGDERLPGGAAEANLAYVIYTSGTTGRPKGVAIEHRQIAGYTAAVSERLELPEDAVYAMVSTFAADLGNTVLFPSLCGGGTLHLIPEEATRDAALLADLLTERPIDCLKIVPSHLAALLEHPLAQRILPRQRLILGGEAADWRLIERVQELVPGCRIFNHYGPTETTVGVLTHPLGRERTAEAPPLGRPLANARAYVLNDRLLPVPAGTPGELYIGGAAVGRGYLGQPALTAERFIPDPYSGEPGARLYRTGDLARHLPDGALQFLGRADQQVKLRGFRVEPAEIEAVLKEHPGVRQAVVRPFLQGEDVILVGYVVPQGSRDVAPAELRGYLADRLPAYMVPASFVSLPGLPLTPNGKLDLRALPAPGQQEEERPRVSPRNPLELQLLHIWEEVLGTRGIGVTDDFFDLGGNSLLSVRLLAMISRQLNRRLPVGILVETRTIEQMARLLASQMEGTRTSHLVAIQPRGQRAPFLCVHPGHGGVSSYLRLSRYLGTDQPFYGLQALDLDRQSDPYRSVEELAALYLKEVRERWPEGPYLLGGWSFGGLVAFEMAQQLLAEGQRIAGLALIDTRSPAANARLARLDPELMKAFLLLEQAKDIAKISARDLPLKPEDIVGLELDRQLDRILAEFDLADAFPGEVDPSLVRRYLELRIARFQAIKNYQPKSYPGKITLFRATEVYEDASLAEAVEIYREAARHPTYLWDELSSQPIEVRPIPGNHESIVFEPDVKVLAEELKRFFSELPEN